MSKKLYLLLAVAVLVVMAFGMIGTGAWFTDKETVSKDVTTGTLDLTIGGSAVTDPISIRGLEPGAAPTHLGDYCINNAGTIDFKWRMKMALTDNPNNLANFLNVQVSYPGVGSIEVPVSYFTTGYIGTGSYGIPNLAAGNDVCIDVSIQLDETAGNDLQGKYGSGSITFEAAQTETGATW